MNTFFDMHCHILPGVDDGAKDFDTALKMIKAAYDDGIRHICFTPHRNPYKKCRSTRSITDVYREFSEAISSSGMEMETILGSEIMYYSDFVSDIENGTCFTIGNSKYVLLEFPENADFSELFEAARKVSSLGYIPIIAHPERYSCIEKKPSLLGTLSENGFLMQFNSGLFAPSHKKDFLTVFRRNRIKKYIFAHKPACIVASDAHDLARRKPSLSAAYDAVLKKCGKDYAQSSFFDIPASIFYNS
ncbi:MAG: hypothetical protein IKV97_05320 [Clostridia bacterium]|nr:hypothetical protein [Clostridia bacterium]